MESSGSGPEVEQQVVPGTSSRDDFNRLGGTNESVGDSGGDVDDSGMRLNLSGQHLKSFFIQRVVQILTAQSISIDVIVWIQSNIAQWKSLECLANCEDLTPRQVKAISECLKSEFERFTLEKQNVLEIVKSLVGTSKDLQGLKIEQVLSDTCDAIINGKLLEFLGSCDLLTREEKRRIYFKFIAPDSETFEKLFGQDVDESMEVEHATCIQPVLTNSIKKQFQVKVCGILRKLDLEDVVEKWILDHICSWPWLESMKECEDLTPRKVKEISELLQESFLDYQEKKQEVKQLVWSVIEDSVTEDVIDAVIDATLDDKLLEFLEQSAQLRVELKRKLYLELTDKQSTDLDTALPLERPSFEAVLKSNFEAALNEAREKQRIPEEAARWLQDNWESFDTIEDVSKCEDLTKKQCKLLIAELTDAFDKYKNYYSLNKDASPDDGKTSDRNDTSDQFFSAVEIEKHDVNESKMQRIAAFLDSISASNEARRWLDEMLSRMKNVPEVLACDELSDSQLKSLCLILRSETSISNEGNEKYQLLQLVSCDLVMQDGTLVEKFSISTESIDKVCNFSGPKKLYFQHASGQVIRFDELDRLKMRPFGVLGRIKDVAAFLARLLNLNPVALESFYEDVERRGTGLYFMCPENFFKSDVNACCFAFFHSAKDEDFAKVHAKSRAIHFLRYLTQLAPKSIALISSEDAPTLTGSKAKKAERTRQKKYTIEKQETQQENCSAVHIGTLTAFNQLNNPNCFYSNMEGVVAVVSETSPEKISIKPVKKTATAQQFVSELYDELKIECEDICLAFQNDFVHEVDPVSFEQINLGENQVESGMKNSAFEKDLQRNLTISVLCRLMVNLCPHEFQLWQLCLNELEGNPVSEMFAKRTEFECFDSQSKGFNECPKHGGKPSPANCVLSFLPESELINEVVDQVRNCKLLQTFFLRKFIRDEKENKDEGDNLESLSFELLVENAKKEKLGKFKNAGSGWMFWKSFDIGKFLDILVSEAKKLTFDPKMVEALGKEMDSILHFVDSIVESISGANKFCAYVQKKMENDVKEAKTEWRNREIEKKFWDLIKGRDEQSVTKKGTLKKVEVERTKDPSDKRYRFHFEASQVDEEKQSLALYKLVIDREQALNLNEPSHPFNSTSLKCSGQLGQKLNLAKTEQLLYVYCVQEDVFMVLINQAHEMSRMSVVNTAKNTDYFSQNFGKCIAACDYDNKTRVLCLQGKTDVEAPELNFYKFSDDFRTSQSYKTLNLKQSLGLETLIAFALQYQSNFVWCLDDRRLLKVDIKSGALSSSVKLTDVTNNKYCKMKMLSNGSCLLLYSEEGSILRVMCETLKVLEEVHLDSGLAKEGFFSIAGRMVGIDKSNKLSEIIVTGASHELKMKADDSDYGTVTNPDDQKDAFNWLHYFYWTFTKFPCSDILAHDQEDIELSFYKTDSFSLSTESLKDCLENCMSSVYESLKKTQKPLDRLKISRVKTISTSPVDACVQFDALPKLLKVGDFVRRLISFVPIQIARCQSNEFYCLENGVPLSTGEVQDAFELQEKISLGLFETIFNEWKGPVKVISSMGKQSTGKSFTLNHLTGSSFNIAGTRCTDGCWMTVKSHKDCLYVILDFEGLGSFERTDQDDVLLSLFNSALSNMTIFKTEYRIDRDTEQMFQKFNKASDMLRGTKKVFQGTFYIVVKDVATHDLDDIHKEFGGKVVAIISQSKENNFLTKLYQGRLAIFPFSAFESPEYYTEMELLALNMQRDIKPVFFSGSDFMQNMKIMLAKLAIVDLTPLSCQQIKSRVRKLRNMIPTALKFGQEKPWPVTEEFPLRDLDDVSNEVPSETKVSLGEDPSLNEIVLNDIQFKFSEDSILDIIECFSELLVQNADNFRQWRSALEQFICCALNHRFKRVATWLEINTQKWRDENNSEFDDEIVSLVYFFENQRNKLEHMYKLCDDKCENCYLKCTQIQGHNGDHRCITNHKCPGFCQYCGEKVKCKLNFGHDDKHICDTVSHVCGEACRFKEANGCDNECRKLIGHEEGHVCSLSKHICHESCSLESCHGKCQLDCEIPHSVHKCAKEQCTSECCVENCHNQCAARDHFHSLPISKTFLDEQGFPHDAVFVLEDGLTRFDCAEHFCGRDHGCGEVCEFSRDGYCDVHAEKEREVLTFEGKLDKFTYSLKFVQKGESKNCVRTLKPFQRSHEGSHSCSSGPDKVHFCKQTCPTCESICDKPTGHGNRGDLLHHTNHGNMRFCYFVSNKEDIEVGQHKYKVGEQAVAELCHLFCSTLGRGHIHVMPCDIQDPKNCVYSAVDDLRRHQTCSYLPDKEVPKDEVQHSKYWESINFVDPCQQSDIESFAKCPFFCSAAEHEEKEDKSFCELALWHKPATSISEAGLSTGTLTEDGHVFPCVHQSYKYHFILALDDSFSMMGQKWSDLVIAVKAFVANRKHQSTSDYLSIMMYSDSVSITAEYINIGSFNASTMLKFRNGGTSFSIALSTVDKIIGRHLSKDVQPCLLFMSDGQSNDGGVEMKALFDKYSTDYNLAVYTLGFGYGDFPKLRELATLGKGTHLKAVDGLELKDAFTEVAAKYPANIGVSSAL